MPSHKQSPYNVENSIVNTFSSLRVDRTRNTLYTVRNTHWKDMLFYHGVYCLWGEDYFTGYTNYLHLYNTTICAARKEETTQRASHMYVYIYLWLCMCATRASNSKSGGCLPDSPTDDPLHGWGVWQEHQAGDRRSAVVSLMSCPSTGCWLALFGQRAHTNGPHCLRLIPDAINPG